MSTLADFYSSERFFTEEYQVEHKKKKICLPLLEVFRKDAQTIFKEDTVVRELWGLCRQNCRDFCGFDFYDTSFFFT